jgi:glycosyltransferase involved in cell wall biosynthesis
METARKELGLPTNIKLAIFSAARVRFDIDLVLRSFARVSKAIPSARLMFTGPRSPLVERFAGKNGLENKIFQCGYVPFKDFPKYLACADIFLVPFRQKIANVGRWPNKVGEYMSVGRPVVSNPVGDVKELFDAEKVGLLASEDPDDFAEKIIFLFDDPKLCEELGNNGRRVAEEQFAWPILTKRLEDFYRSFF